MKKLVKTESGYQLEELNGISGFIDCVKAPIKPVLGEALTPGDGFISAASFFVIGALVGGTVGYKTVKKAQNAFNAYRGREGSQYETEEALA